jgi:hypothetical protein
VNKRTRSKIEKQRQGNHTKDRIEAHTGEKKGNEREKLPANFRVGQFALGGKRTKLQRILLRVRLKEGTGNELKVVFVIILATLKLYNDDTHIILTSYKLASKFKRSNNTNLESDIRSATNHRQWRGRQSYRDAYQST